MRSTGRYILIGVLTIAPLWVTWIVLEFIFRQLVRVGRPWVQAVAGALAPDHPVLASWIQDDKFQSLLAFIAMLAFLYLLGLAASHVVGRRLIDLFEKLVGLIPFVDTVYRSTKKFLAVASTTPEAERRVVLIEFPSPEMKAVGLLMRTMRDADTGAELAAVYVPTSPNPTSGYIEIVPKKDIVLTDWTFDEAMAFVISGGTNAPDSIRYSRSTAREPDARVPRTVRDPS